MKDYLDDLVLELNFTSTSAASISPVWSQSLFKEIPDPEIQVAVETAVAASLLGAPDPGMYYMRSSKNGQPLRVMAAPLREIPAANKPTVN